MLTSLHRSLLHLSFVSSAFWLGVLAASSTAAETVRLIPVANYNDGRVLPANEENPPDLEMTRDGRFIFATRITANTTLYAYLRDKDTGKLELCTSLSKPLVPIARILGTSPDSRFAYVSAAPDILSFALNGQTGQLTQHQKLQNLKERIVGLRGVEVLCSSPDGKSLYMAGDRDKTLVCFRVNPETGNAAFEECLQSAKAGQAEPGTSIVLTKSIKDARRVEGIGAIRALACSPDGQHVLAASDAAGKALTVFVRDQENGRLVQTQTLEDPRPLFNNIRNLGAIAFHPKGTHVVVCSILGGISHLERDAETGELTFIEAYVDEGTLPEPRDQLHMTEGLKNTSDVIWSPDGCMVFTASYGDNAIVGFRFDPKANHLTPAVCIRPEDSIEGLVGVDTLCISPDGRFLYSGSRHDTVTVFEIKLTKD